MGGWIKLHRRIQTHWIYLEVRKFSRYEAWLDLILMANHQDNKIPHDNQIVEVKRGSFITSELKLMARWGWGKEKVRAFLQLLQNDGMIKKASTRRQTTIFINNYDDYQQNQTDGQTDGQTDENPYGAWREHDTDDQALDRIEDQKQTENRPETDYGPYTNKNLKNVKNLINGLFDHWNSLKIVKHGKLTPVMESQLKWKLNDHSVEDLKFSMGEYAAILFDEEYVLSTKWGLVDFLEKGHFEKFLPDRDARNYYPNVKKGKPPFDPQAEFKPRNQMTDEEAWAYMEEHGML